MSNSNTDSETAKKPTDDNTNILFRGILIGFQQSYKGLSTSEMKNMADLLETLGMGDLLKFDADNLSISDTETMIKMFSSLIQKNASD